MVASAPSALAETSIGDAAALAGAMERAIDGGRATLPDNALR